MIFVMEKKTRGRIMRGKLGEALDGNTVICLRIPDVYRFMEPALIEGCVEWRCRFARLTKLCYKLRCEPQGHLTGKRHPQLWPKVSFGRRNKTTFRLRILARASSTIK